MHIPAFPLQVSSTLQYCKQKVEGANPVRGARLAEFPVPVPTEVVVVARTDREQHVLVALPVEARLRGRSSVVAPTGRAEPPRVALAAGGGALEHTGAVPAAHAAPGVRRAGLVTGVSQKQWGPAGIFEAQARGFVVADTVPVALLPRQDGTKAVKGFDYARTKKFARRAAGEPRALALGLVADERTKRPPGNTVCRRSRCTARRPRRRLDC